MAKHQIRLSDSEISSFCGQLSYMVKAGVPLQEGLLLMEEDLGSGEGGGMVHSMLDSLESGETLAAALRKTGSFPAYMVSMVDIGEASGRLEQVMDSLAAYYERQESIAKSVKSSVTYPLILIAMMVAVILVVIIAVLPVFQDVFHQLGGELSGFVQGLMQFGQGVSNSAVVIIAVVAALIAVYLVLRATPKGRRALSGLYERMFRQTAAAMAAGRFASAMSLMLGSGMDVDEALSMSAELQESRGALQKISRIRQMVDGGKSFAEAIAESGMFSGLQGKMVAVGFKTGTLDSVMQRIARQYEEEAERRMDGIVSALEPTLVAILSLIVGLILLSVMLPLMGVMSAIG